MSRAFNAQIDRWARKSQARVMAVYRQSLQAVINEAQQTREKGGNMRVDTGFLRNSGQAALNAMPTGGSSPTNMTSVPLVLTRAGPDDEVVFGWTANYARVREAQDGFMRLAVQNWPQIVARENKRVKRRVTR